MDTAKTISALVAAAALLGAGGVLSERVKPALTDTGALTGAQQERLEKIASASLFGQFRTSLSDYLWLKADKYMHKGVDLRGMTDQEKATANADKVSTNARDEVKMKHTEETTVVPSKARDWRGHLGDIEREVSPYKDMNGHGHEDARETLPLFRLMTWSNPHFIKGYIVGSTLISGTHKIDDAIQFLHEGEVNNPESIEIKTEIGYFLTSKKKQYDAAMPYLIKAIELARSRDSQTLNEDENQAWQDAYRWAVLSRRESKDFTAARKFAHEGLSLFPNDIICREFLEKYGE